MNKEQDKKIDSMWIYITLAVNILIAIPFGLGYLVSAKSKIPNFSQSND